MKVRILDKAALEAIGPTALRAYLVYERSRACHQDQADHIAGLSAALAYTAEFPDDGELCLWDSAA